jgi:hypothetical protein
MKLSTKLGSKPFFAGLAFVACAYAPLSSAERVPSAEREPLELWLYYSTNLWVEENLDRLGRIWARAAEAGYTKVLLADSKFAKLGDMDRRYFENVERVKRTAKDLSLEIVPALFHVGYSNSMLWHDPNLAEGLPVRAAPFEVQGGVGRPVSDPPVALGEKPDWKDDCVRLERGVATVEGNPSNARLVWKLTVARFRPYHVSVEVKTEGYTGEPQIAVLAGGKALNHASLGVEGTQDWKEHHIVFNSLESAEASVYLGVWGGAKGKLSWRGWKIEEAGLVNVLRRPGAPLVVDGYIEGRDFKPIEDPLLGSRPWKGEYEPWHEPPLIRTGLPDGTRLRVSWYAPAIIYRGQVSACLSEPRVDELLADEARRMREAWGTRGYMMSHDEIRTLNWDAACQERKLDAGAILAENVRRCAGLLEGSTAYVWSDMFDPHHNAHADYYLVRGDFSGSWEGLPKDAVVVNWNFGKRDASLRFFAERGHRQVIAGYYDGPVEGARDWLAAAAGVRGVVGIMYTTWRSAYDDIEAFAKACGR